MPYRLVGSVGGGGYSDHKPSTGHTSPLHSHDDCFRFCNIIFYDKNIVILLRRMVQSLPIDPNSIIIVPTRLSGCHGETVCPCERIFTGHTTLLYFININIVTLVKILCKNDYFPAGTTAENRF
ncbi:hypothetical protein QTP88_007242 [Uroleucon formosanum]